MVAIRHVLIALSSCLMAIGSNAHAQADPPIVESKDADGKTIRTQTWETDEGGLTLGQLTIADWYYVWGDAPSDHSRKVATSLRCDLAPAVYEQGFVVGPCRPECGDLSAMTCGIAERYVQRAVGGYPLFRSDKRKHRKDVERSLRVPLQLELPAKPHIDLSQGEIIHSSELFSNRLALGLYYPARALANDVESKIMLMCQVQADYSVICEDRTDPATPGYQYFRREVDRVARRAKPNRELADGRSTVGLRANFALRYVIPD